MKKLLHLNKKVMMSKVNICHILYINFKKIQIKLMSIITVQNILHRVEGFDM